MEVFIPQPLHICILQGRVHVCQYLHHETYPDARIIQRCRCGRWLVMTPEGKVL